MVSRNQVQYVLMYGSVWCMWCVFHIICVCCPRVIAAVRFTCIYVDIAVCRQYSASVPVVLCGIGMELRSDPVVIDAMRARGKANKLPMTHIIHPTHRTTREQEIKREIRLQLCDVPSHTSHPTHSHTHTQVTHYELTPLCIA